MHSKLQNGIKSLFELELMPWDEYFPAMAQTDFFLNRHWKKATKTFFIRKAPFGGSYAILAGLNEFFRILNDFSFNDEVLNSLEIIGYKKEFLSFLKEKKKLNLKVYSILEGQVFFPNEPAIILEGDLVSVRLAEGILCSVVNYPSLAMTKWSRVKLAASPGKVLEFSRRRAQNHMKNSLYAHLAGIDFTSNSAIRKGFDIPTVGTMGHEWIQSIGDEFEAFDKWLEHNPDKPVLLIDTINTLKSGLPNAIKAFKKHWEKIKNAGGTPGIRNDSGDLAYLTLEERIKLDKAGLEDVLIFQTNDLDEYKIQNIKEQIFTQTQRSGIKNVIERTVWAAGTMPGTCYDQPSLGGVAKLTSIEDSKGKERPVIKIAKDNRAKTSIPGNTRSAWVYKEDNLLCSMIYLNDKPISEVTSVYHLDDKNKHILFTGDERYELRQQLTYDNSLLFDLDDVETVRNRVKNDLDKLHWTHKRFEQPHLVKVSLTKDLFELRQELISRNQLIQNWG